MFYKMGLESKRRGNELTFVPCNFSFVAINGSGDCYENGFLQRKQMWLSKIRERQG